MFFFTLRHWLLIMLFDGQPNMIYLMKFERLSNDIDEIVYMSALYFNYIKYNYLFSNSISIV